MKKPGIDLARFSWIETQKTVKDRGREVILNHYPILFFGKNHTRDKEGKLSTYMLHGHVHRSYGNFRREHVHHSGTHIINACGHVLLQPDRSSWPQIGKTGSPLYDLYVSLKNRRS